MSTDNQGRRSGEGRIETNTQRAKENWGNSGGSSKGSSSATDSVRNNVKDKVSGILNRK